MPMAWLGPCGQAPQRYGKDPPLSECPEPIAIVGMGCRFPGGASDPSKLWDLLISKRNGYSVFPPDRLNIDGFYHPNKDRPGSLYTKGGYFIDEDPRQFDHGFFGITPLETMNLDPTQRKLLETAYEAFENGGESLESLSGSKTGVYVGNILFEHYMMQLRDADFTLPYLTTGGSPTILSNRVNYVFNLKGPSMTLDTACSSSMYALHLAVNALRNGDCDAALVAGTQLILGPEIQISCARLGALSPTSQCHTFDAAADGYARAEGFGTLYIKKLSDAVKNGDPIRAVIRGTAVNTNGRTAGIAHPSPEGQEAVIRSAYENAGGLDPALTGLFECHGTGTQVGDPLEVSAIGRVFGSGRKEDNPLLIGSIKTNLGHAEAASGIAGVMKAVLAIENGIIPPTIGLVNPNPNINFRGAKVKVVTDVTQWPTDKPIRRASVNSFGFGGANAHCILEHVSSVAPGYQSKGTRRSANGMGASVPAVNDEENRNRPQHTDKIVIPNGVTHNDSNISGKVKGLTSSDPGTKLIHQQQCGTRQKVLVPFSAFDDNSLEANIAAASSVLNDYNLSDIAYTLSARRSRFTRRAFAIIKVDDGCCLPNEDVATGSPELRDQLVGFVFTGQGAQWPGMGLKLYKEYEAFRASIRYQNNVLRRLRDGPGWTIEEVLMEPDASSKIHDAQFSQALCTSIQIALVDLLHSWHVVPVVSVGHSSGEIAAGYASGHLTAAEAIVMAYYRGKVVEMNQKDGRMLAVGRGPDEVLPYLHDVQGRVGIACYNSPSSTTLSGDTDAIIQISERLESDKIFNRILKTSNNAYHSHHMAALGPVYEDLAAAGLKDIAAEIDLERENLNRPQTLWVSSVTPSEDMTAQVCGPSYWRKNLESPVQFMQAVELISEIVSVQGSILVELGPHPALNGPLKQIRAKVGDKLGPCLGSISRSSDGLEDMLKLAGNLFLHNASVDLARVNAIDTFDGAVWNLARGSCCIDLPKYCFNYGPNVYYENRLNKEWRFRKHLRHDVLGAKIQGCSKFRPTWRNILKAKDLPWLREQEIYGQAVLSSGAYLAMAMEAVTQFYEEDDNMTEIAGFSFKEVEIKCLLRIPDNDFGVETVFDLNTMQPHIDKGKITWFEFNVSSVPADGGDWVDVCSGIIEIKHEHTQFASSMTIAKSKKVDVERWYARLTEVGATLGPSFQLLSDLNARNKDGFASAMVSASLPEDEIWESRYIIHPATLDSVFLLGIIAGHCGQAEKIRTPFIPTTIKECTIWKSSDTTPHLVNGKAFAEAVTENLHLTATAQLWSQSGMPLLEVKGLELTRHSPPEVMPEPADDPFLRLVWKPDVTVMTNEAMRSKYPAPSKAAEVGEIFDRLEELAIYAVVDMHEEHKDKYDDKRRDELQLFLDWIQRTVGYAADGKIPYGSEALTASPEERRERIHYLNSALGDVVEAKLISAIFYNLSAILAGSTSGLQVALENNLLAELYISGYSITRAYPQLINIVDSLAHKNPRMDIIEVGGGTGGATREILKALGAPIFKRYHSYTFTDVSNGFLSAVENEFSSNKGMAYKTLDLERDPSDQGYESTSDLVIASQVLHTTSSILKSVQHARKLLKPGGKLVMLELTRVWLGAGIVLGTFPGYWNGHNDGRLDSPFVDSTGWHQLLTASGFSGIDISLDDHEQPYTLTSVMVATAVEHKPAITIQPSQNPAIYLIYKNSIDPLGKELEKMLLENTQPIQVKLSDASNMISPHSRIISLVDISDNEAAGKLENPLQELEDMRSLISHASSLLWVYAGNPIEGFKPESGVRVGLLRSIAAELPHIKIASLGLEKSFPSNLIAVANTVIERENYLQEVELGASRDHEYILHNGTVQISRLEPEEQLNSWYNELENKQANIVEATLGSLGPVSLSVMKPGDFTTAHWSKNEMFSGPLQDDWVEVKIKAINLTKDLAKFESSQGIVQFSGVVHGIGPSVKQLQLFDHVFGAVVAAPSNLIRAPATSLSKFAGRATFSEVALIPVTYRTGMYAVQKVQEQSRGTMSLVFGADSTSGLAAAKWTFKYLQELVVVVEEYSRDAVRNALHLAEDEVHSINDVKLEENIASYSSKNGEPHRVVLSFGGIESLLQAAHFVSYGGVLVDVSGIGSQCYAQLAPLLARKNASFESFDLKASIEADRSDPSPLIEYRNQQQPLICDKFAANIEPFNASQTESALTRALVAEEDTSIVLTFDDEDLDMLRIKSAPTPMALDPKAAYVIAGGLGGLGRSISTWMVERGARYLIFVSRRNSAEPEALDAMEELHAKGVKTDKILYSGSNKEELVIAIRDISRNTAIKGVVHVAMGEDNAAVESASQDQLELIFSDKVQGTIDLHEATLQNPLEFFVMACSVVTMVGMARQDLLIAANAFLESFARYRWSKGLPGQAISFGPVLEVVPVADPPSVQTALQRIGLSSNTEYGFLRLFELALAGHHLPQDSADDAFTGAHLVTGMEPRQLHKLHLKGIANPVAWHSDTRFARVLTAVEDLTQTRVVKSQDMNVLDVLKDSSPNERQDVITKAMCKKLESLCYLTPGSIDTRKAVMTYGIDSMIAAEFRSWLFKIFDVYISFLELLSPNTKIQGLVELVLEHLGNT